MRFQWLKYLKAQFFLIPIGTWAQQLGQLPKQAQSQASSSTCSTKYVIGNIYPIQSTEIPPMYLYLHQMIFYTAGYMTFLNLFLLFIFSLSNIFQLACKTHLLAHRINYNYINTLYHCMADQLRTMQISLSASSIIKHVLHTNLQNTG